jgi:hypothetical protein
MSSKAFRVGGKGKRIKRKKRKQCERGKSKRMGGELASEGGIRMI